MRNNRFRKAIIICLIVEAIVIFGILGKPLIPPELAALPFYYELLYLAVVHIFGVAALLLFLLGRPRENWFQDTFPASTDQLTNSSIEPEYDVSTEEVDALIAEMEQIVQRASGSASTPPAPSSNFFNKFEEMIHSAPFCKASVISVILGIVSFVILLLWIIVTGHAVPEALTFCSLAAIFWPFLSYALYFVFAFVGGAYDLILKKTKSRIITIVIAGLFFAVIIFALCSHFSTGESGSAPISTNEIIETSEVSEEDANFIASSQGEKFHKPGCRYVDNISTGNKVYYETREDAIADGKTACSVCDP